MLHSVINLPNFLFRAKSSLLVCSCFFNDPRTYFEWMLSAQQRAICWASRLVMNISCDTNGFNLNILRLVVTSLVLKISVCHIQLKIAAELEKSLSVFIHFPYTMLT